MQLERLDETRRQSLHFVEINQNRQKARLDAKIRKGWERHFNEGDLVLCFDNRLDHQLDKKFLPTWSGPYKVIRERSNGLVEVHELADPHHQKVCNKRFLKPFHTRL